MVDAQTLMSIYDAATDEARWGPALNACADLTGARGVMLYEFPSVSQVHYRLEETNDYFLGIRDVLEEYNEIVSKGQGTGFDTEGIRIVHKSDVFTTLFDEEVWKMDAEFSQRPEMILNVRAGFYRRALVNLSNDPNSLRGLVLLFGREYDDGLPIGLKDLGTSVAPHFLQAIEINRFTQELRHRFQAVLAVLDRIATGILVLSRNGDILVANRVALDLLDADDGIGRRRSGQLMFRGANMSSEFLQKVRDVSETARGENDDAGSSVEIHRPSGGPPVVALIAPLRDANMEIERGLSGALVTFIDPSREVKVELDAMVLAYGLTKSEARTASFVIKGLTTNEIAEQLDRSPETIKTQLKSIFGKCGCRNRIEFLWRVFQLSPPVS